MRTSLRSKEKGPKVQPLLPRLIRLVIGRFLGQKIVYREVLADEVVEVAHYTPDAPKNREKTTHIKEQQMERKIEQKLVQQIKKNKGMALKLVSPGCAGVPDRLILFFPGKCAFVEVKEKGKKPRKLQLKRHEQLRQMGFKVFVLDDEEQIEGIINEITDKGEKQNG